MDASERERLRQRLNFPSVIVDDDDPEPPVGPAPDVFENDVFEHVDEPSSPETASREISSPDVASPDVASPDPTAGLIAALDRLTDAVERIDGRLENTRAELRMVHERLDRLEFALPSDIALDDLAGIEAVRRTVAASHRALTAQLGRMFEGLEGRMRHQDRMAVSVGSSD